ncbi:MAG: sigma-70 family RNA polymerase sigma factor [Phycisphaerae bacterium]|nr:sigma-70 family RNA polymerase sigma factor [Phycisphaerae bacterium]
MTVSTESSSGVTDAQLMQRHLDGDAGAFAALVRRYKQPLYGYLVRFTGDATLAEDVFQETFLKVYQAAGSFDLSRKFRPWLYTVATNKARDALRKKNRHRETPLDAPIGGDDGQDTSYAKLMPSNIPSPDEISVNLETRQAVQTMVNQMPDNLREVLAMSYLKELPHKEIAKILSIPVGTVKSRLHAAVRHFAEKWKAWAEEQTKRNENSPPRTELN